MRQRQRHSDSGISKAAEEGFSSSPKDNEYVASTSKQNVLASCNSNSNSNNRTSSCRNAHFPRMETSRSDSLPYRRVRGATDPSSQCLVQSDCHSLPRCTKGNSTRRTECRSLGCCAGGGLWHRRRRQQQQAKQRQDP